MRGLSDVASEPPGEREVRNVLGFRDFRRLWIALSLSSLGDWLGFVATTALATELESRYSARLYAVASVIAVRLAPAIIIGPFAGAWGDRFNRRYTMVTADVLRFGLYVSIPLVHTLWWLLVAAFLIEGLSQFWIPAKEATVPNLVPPSYLESANRISLITTYGSAAVASTLFALLAEINNLLAHAVPHFRSNQVDLALYLDAATFLVSAATIWSLRSITTAQRASTASGEHVSTLRSVAEGWRFLASSTWLKGLVVGILGAVAAGAVAIGLAPSSSSTSTQAKPATASCSRRSSWDSRLACSPDRACCAGCHAVVSSAHPSWLPAFRCHSTPSCPTCCSRWCSRLQWVLLPAWSGCSASRWSASR